MNMLCNIFLWFVYSTLAASAVALFVMLVQQWFQHRMSARVQHALWLIVLIRMIIPVFPNSHVSLFNIVPFALDIKEAVSNIIPFTQNKSPHEVSNNSRENEFLETDPNRIAPDNLIRQEAVSPQEAPVQAPPSIQRHSLGLKIVSIVWFVGMAAILIYLFVYMLKMKRTFRTLRIVTDPRIVSVLDACRAKFGIKISVPVYTGCYAKSPYISGQFRPWIYLPETACKELSTSQLFHVFSHELAHFKRKDIAWNTIGSYILAIHWMNPFVWVCIRKMKAVRELACDAYALEVLGEAEAIPYGMTIIEFLKRYFSKRDQPNLLYFDGSNNDNQMARRIRMITSFKKGSYKLSALAVICVAVISMTTLTNAAKPAPQSSSQDQPANASPTATATDRMLFDSSLRDYNNLEKAVQVADFRFKVPAVLPEGYKFKNVTLSPLKSGGNKLSKAKIYFERLKDNIHLGNMDFSAVSGESGLEAAYTEIETYERNGATSELVIKKEPLNIQGLVGLKVTFGTGKKEKLYYLWQDNDIVYQMNGYGDSTSQNVLTMISSMKYPDQEMNERYVSKDMLIARIYDTGDLRQAPESIGFTPKFPLQLSGEVKAVNAFITQKINFSFPVDEADRKTRLLTIGYARADTNSETVKSFDFMQIKNNNQYEDIKKNGYVAFYRIDGQPNVVNASPLGIGGMEVLKTDKYKIDGPLSSPNEADYVSYFWKENDVCFQVAFKEDGSQQSEIIKSLMNAKSVDFNHLE